MTKKHTYYELNNMLNQPNDKGEIQLDKDKEAAKAFFIDHVNQNTVFFHSLKEKLDYLVDNDYIDSEILDNYSYQFIKKLFKRVYAKKHRFNTFMGAYKFYRQYALKTNDGKRYLERYEDRIAFNALTFGNGNEELAIHLADEMINRRYQPATPTFLNAGRKRRGEFVSCFLVRMEDNMNSIGRTINSALQLSKIGGGVGILLTDLRPKGSTIKGIENAGSGVVPVMKVLEDSFKYANQLGQRQGAGAVYLNIFHQDVLDFLATRKENADDAIRVKMLSLGLVVPDKFYELVEKDEVMHLFNPQEILEEYGELFSQFDITERYDELVSNPNLSKTTIKARDLDTEISKLQQESGYPYIMNYDTVNRENPVDGTISMSNLCSEILQVQTPSEINDDQTYKVLGKDISCNLGSLNIPNLMKITDKGGLYSSIGHAMQALTYIADTSDIKTVPTVKNGNDASRSVGLGAMGLHTYFATLGVQYGSPESVEITDKLFEIINYASLFESCWIAKETQEVFVGFEKSKYADGSYFDKYINRGEHTFKYDITRKIFEHLVPTLKDWISLANDVKEYGLYHQNRLAVAPNGSISYVNETSSSLHPITHLIEKRQEGKTGSTFYPAPLLSNETLPYYKSAYDTSMLDVIDVYASAQKHVDQGMSLTLFMRSEIPAGLYPWKKEGGKLTTRDLSLIRHYAWKKGIKTIYYVRTFTEDETEVGINQCESCSV
ncbi:class 1b ribonucleoside-diphosphate reductase subunit alpha [Enterococcus cecorum]|uniref:class 1b ribonucleoside-diphosphate reductase subunit alpha n=1 Tax=Enterococcus cecorum TaxID=44008 RepID=UPI00148C071C|nr:class 1b ribonucleoside-diphosphate reductase subunit alpha [Enterococcus cecorum]